MNPTIIIIYGPMALHLFESTKSTLWERLANKTNTKREKSIAVISINTSGFENNLVDKFHFFSVYGGGRGIRATWYWSKTNISSKAVKWLHTATY